MTKEELLKCWPDEDDLKSIEDDCSDYRGIDYKQMPRAIYEFIEGKIENLEVANKSVNIKLTKDGNEYCFLLGENLQEGIAGFGKSILEALTKFKNVWGNDMDNKYRVSRVELYFNDLVDVLEEERIE